MPKHARRYASLGETMKEATAAYIKDVQVQAFPTDKESYTIKHSVLQEIYGAPAQSA